MQDANFLPTHIPLSRSAAGKAPNPLTLARNVVGPQPAFGKVVETVTGKGKVSIDSLREGDILLCLGNYPSSCLVCCCACSPGSSHVGIVVRLGGRKWLAEATSFQEQDVILWGNPPRPSGVIASDLVTSQKYYTAIDIYRPRNMTEAKKEALRSSFLYYKDKKYEKATCSILAVACGLPCSSPNSLFCSELSALMLNDAGMLKDGNCTSCTCIPCAPEWRREAFTYRPSDVPQITQCDRLGSLEGTRSILDVRGWSFGIC